MTLLDVYSPLSAGIFCLLFIAFIFYVLYAANAISSPENYKDDETAALQIHKPLHEVMQLRIENSTDSTQECTLMEIFHKNVPGVVISSNYIDSPDFDFMKRWLLVNPSKTERIRIANITGRELTGKQYEHPIYCISYDPMGRSCQSPAIDPIEEFSPKQFQEDIIDAEYELKVDGVSSDLKFKLLPHHSLSFTLFIKERRSLEKFVLVDKEPVNEPENKIPNGRNVLRVTLENVGDEVKEMDVFDFLSSHVNSSDIIRQHFEQNTFGVNSARVFVTEGNHKQAEQELYFTKSGNRYSPIDVPDKVLNIQSRCIDINLPVDEIIGGGKYG